MAFQRHIIPEIPGIDWTSRCENCDCTWTQPVAGDGPVPARVFLLGERSGAEALSKHFERPFTGKAGRELNHNYLELAGLTRDEIYFANSIRCAHPKNQTPGKQLIQSCTTKFLPLELNAVQPTFIIPMGGTACSLFDNIHLATHHGMPLRRELFGRTYWVVPQFHPALGLHDPKKMTPMLEDWARLRLILDGDYVIPRDLYPNPEYRLVRGRQQVEQYLKPIDGFPKWVLYGGLDTETDAGRLWCITVSVAPGTGIMILASDHEGIAAFRELCNYYHWFIHNAIFDLDKLMEADIHLKNVTCTMQAAYHRGNVPQGLKQLAWRLLGITMTEYEDVVIPWSKAKLREWWLEALMHLDKEQIVTRRFSDKTGKELKPSVKSTRLFSRMSFIYKHDLKDERGTYDMWKMWDKLTGTEGITDADRRHVLDLVGPPPRPSIIHVPMEDGEGFTGAITYACLASHVKVRTENGLRTISDLVTNSYSGNVYSYNESTKSVELKPVTGWYRVDSNKVDKWLQIKTNRLRSGGRWGSAGNRYTADHKLLTPTGWKQVDTLKTGDDIYLPYMALDSVQDQVVIGSILGDGTLSVKNKKNGWSNLRISHCEKQLPYLEWKSYLLGSLSLGITKPTGGGKRIQLGGRWINTGVFYPMATVHHPQIMDYNEASYHKKAGGKHVGYWIKSLDVLGLAIWYQDDGCIVKTSPSFGTPRFATDGFSRSDVECLCDHLNDRFGFEPSMVRSRPSERDDQWWIHLNIKSASIFYEMIAQYTHPCMQYKLPDMFRGLFNPEVKRETNGLAIAKVISVDEWKPKNVIQGKRKDAWCIDVADNHNFLTLNEIAHNCRDCCAGLRLGLHFRSQERQIRRTMTTVV